VEEAHPSAPRLPSERVPYESLDYDPIVNTRYMQWLQQTYAPARRRLLGYSGRTFTRWLLCWTLGVFTGALAWAVSVAVGGITRVRLAAIDALFRHYGRGAEALLAVGCVFVATNLAMALAAALLVTRVSPQAAGSGLPAVRAYLNGVHVPRCLSSECLLVKFLGTILAVGSLLSIGPEGPLVHLGAIVGSGLTRGRKHLRVKLPWSNGRPRSVVLSWPWLLHFRNDVDRRDFISIGAAAGFSAAFGAPVGGVLYCLEECSSHWSQQLVWRALTTTAVSSVTLMLLRAWSEGEAPRVTDLGLLTLNTLHHVGPLVSGNAMSSTLELVLYGGLGAIGGLVGAAWNRAWAALSNARPRREGSKLLEVALISVVTSAILFALPLALGICSDAKELDTWTSNRFGARFACAEGQYDELASLLLSGREMGIKQVISRPENFTNATLACTCATFVVLMAATFGAAVPAGIFMPTIMAGCTLGGILGKLLQVALGEDKITPGTFALMGAVALLGGVQRSTISLCIIILEGTGQVQLLVPIIVTTVCARYVGNLLSEGVYELALEHHRPRIPLVHLPHNMRLARYRASEIMASEVECLPREPRVRHVRDLLNRCRHNGFPVVDAQGHLLGLILRSQLLALLRQLQAQQGPGGEPSYGSLAEVSAMDQDLRDVGPVEEEGAIPRHTALAMSSARWSFRRVSTKARLEDAVVSQAAALDLEQRMDLADELNIGPILVLANTPASRVYAIFSSMGLRHLPVISAEGSVVGIITRHDLSRFQERIDGHKAH